jgi:hypothetical protein
MGVHAWWKYDLEFWAKLLYPDLEPVSDLAQKRFANAKIESGKAFERFVEGMKIKLEEQIHRAFDDFERQNSLT